jgi:integrase
MKREDFEKYDLTPLERYSLEKIDASVILDIRRPKDSGYYPVKYRVTFNRKQSYYPCMDVTVDEYSRLHGQVRDHNLKKTMKLITEGFKRITDLIEDLVNKEGFTHEGLARRLRKGTTDSILNSFDNKIATLTEAGQIGSASGYSCAKNSIEKYAQRDLKFSDITPDWLRKYETHLLDKKKSYTTISMYMRSLRSIINEGKALGVINESQYPFIINNNGKYQIPEGEGRKLALTAPQLMKVFNYPMLPQDEKWRDLWIFSFYSNGINLNDLLKLKFRNISDGEISWYRQKTIKQDRKKKEIRAIITEEMQRIMISWGNPQKKPDNYIFPFLSPGLSPTDQRNIVKNVTHTVNKKMKKIGKALGYGNITTYAARHSFATVLKRGGANLASISESMGHANIKTTEAYFDSFGKEERIKNAALLPRRSI